MARGPQRSFFKVLPQRFTERGGDLAHAPMGVPASHVLCQGIELRGSQIVVRYAGAGLSHRRSDLGRLFVLHAVGGSAGAATVLATGQKFPMHRFGDGWIDPFVRHRSLRCLANTTSPVTAEGSQKGWTRGR